MAIGIFLYVNSMSIIYRSLAVSMAAVYYAQYLENMNCLFAQYMYVCFW